MKKILVGGVLLFSALTTMSQRSKVLTLGDEIPAFTTKNTWSGNMKQISKADLKGKLTILDFWGLKCPTCIVRMPYMDSLQKEFGEKIRIVGVARNTSHEVDSFFTKKKLSRPRFSSIMSDTLLNQWFPHLADPLHVWLDSNAQVVAISHGYHTTREAIRSALSGGKVNLPLRVDGMFSDGKNFFSEQNSFVAPLSLFHSIFLREAIGTIHANGVRVKPNFFAKQITSINVANKSLSNMYAIAYGKELYGFNISVSQLSRNNPRIILELKDSLPFLEPPVSSESYSKWSQNNIYSYEVSINTESDLDAYKIMQQDLERYFPYRVTIEKRCVKHMALIRTSGADKIKTSSQTKGFLTVNKDTLVVQNLPISEGLLRRISSANFLNPIPIVDKTDYKGNIDISIVSYLTDFDKLSKQLQKYDLDIVESNDEIEVLVIRDGQQN